MASDEAGQKAMLFFIEVLMNSGQSLSVDQLASRFSTRTFTPDMVKAAGGDAAGLRDFLTKYTSLFVVEGDLVSINNHGVDIPAMSETSAYPDPHIETEALKFFEDHLVKKGGRVPIKSLAGHLSQAPPRIRHCVGPQVDFKRFLQQHSGTFTIEGDYVVSSTAPSLGGGVGALAQDLRSSGSVSEPSTPTPSKKADTTGGRQAKPAPISMTASEYKAMKYVKDEIDRCDKARGEGLTVSELMVKLADAAPAQTQTVLGQGGEHLLDFITRFATIFTLSEGAGDTLQKVVSVRKTRLNVVMVGSRPMAARAAEDSASSVGAGGGSSSATLTRSQSGSFSRDKRTGGPVHLTSQTSREDVFTPPVVAKGDGSVSQGGGGGVGSAEGNRPLERSSSISSPQPRTVNNSCGPVYHLAKLWGILDLGKHEHVFFDRSILPDSYDDLTKQFRIGENLRFNAVRAARGSRARWRATHIWRDGQDIRSMYGDNSSFSLAPLCCDKMEEEVKRFLPKTEGSVSSPTGSAFATNGRGSRTTHRSGSGSSSEEPDVQQSQPQTASASPYTDATPSSTGFVPVWRANGGTSTTGQAGDSAAGPALELVSETNHIKSGISKDARFVPGYFPAPLPRASGTSTAFIPPVTQNGDAPKFRDATSQTISTGEIMATQLYEETL